MIYIRHNSDHTRITAFLPILNIIWDKRNAVNHLFVKSWGSQRVLLETMTLVTTDFISQYKIRESILK